MMLNVMVVSKNQYWVFNLFANNALILACVRIVSFQEHNQN